MKTFNALCCTTAATLFIIPCKGLAQQIDVATTYFTLFSHSLNLRNMKSMLFVISFLALSSSLLIGQNSTNLLPLQKKGLRYYYNDSKVKSVKKIQSIVNQAHDAEADNLIAKARLQDQIANGLYIGGAGLTLVGTLISFKTDKLGLLNYEYNHLTTAGLVLSVGGIVTRIIEIATLNKAVEAYNNKIKKVSFAPAQKGMGIQVRF